MALPAKAPLKHISPAAVTISMSTFTSRTIRASDGVRLHFQHWKPEGPSKGIVVCLHGIQSHAGWYEYSSSRISREGYDVYFLDRRGSGRNGFLRGHADHGLRLLNDVRQLVRLCRREQKAPAPLSLLGLSWGGKLAAAFAATYPKLIDSLALLSPGLVSHVGPNVWQRFQLRFARRHDLRHKSVVIPLQDAALFTANLQWQQFIDNDPLVLRRVTSGLLNSGVDLDRVIASDHRRITQPTLLMLAGNDAIVDNAATKKLVAQFESSSLQVINYPEAQHTLEFESNRIHVADDLLTWLQQSVAP